jgi:hypothetical protein
MVTPDLSRTSAPACGYATSVILPAGQQANDEGQGARRSRPDQAAAARALMVLAAEYWGPGPASPSALSSQKGK